MKKMTLTFICLVVSAAFQGSVSAQIIVNQNNSFKSANEPVCFPSHNSPSAPMSVFDKEGPYKKTAQGYVFSLPTIRCARFLGNYFNATKLGGNEGLIQGKYLTTSILSFRDIYPNSQRPDIPGVYRENNDFTFQLTYGDQIETRESALALSQANAYFHITEYIEGILKPDLQAIHLDPNDDRAWNMLNLGYRPNLKCVGTNDLCFDNNYAGFPSLHLVLEDYVDQAFTLLPKQNLELAPSLARFGITEGNDLSQVDPLSYSYDSGFTVGEHLGLRAFALTKTDYGFPSEYGFGSNWSSNSDMSPVLNDALNLWIDYDYTGNPDGAENFWYMLRRWHQLFDSSNEFCDSLGKPACLSGNNIDSALSYRFEITDRDSIFPPRQPDTYLQGMGAIDADLSAIYIANIFFEIHLFIGNRLTTQLFWQLIANFDDTQFQNLSMIGFGQLLIDSAIDLFGEDSEVPEIVRHILVKKGIPTNLLDSNIDHYLPTAVGSYPQSLEKNSSNRFGSSFPDSQPTVDNSVDGPGSVYFYSNGYFQSPSPYFKGMGLQMWEGSRYGPCDHLAITDGSFVGVEYQNDGTYYREFKGRELENLVIIVPGNLVRWMRYRKKCDDWNQGDYTNDFRPPGFRVTQAEQNGYSFRVTRISETATTISYRLTIVDPLALLVPDVTSIQYQWQVSDSLGTPYSFQESQDGSYIEVSLRKNAGVQITLDRLMDIEAGLMHNQVESHLNIFDRTNDLDRQVPGRSPGEAFVVNLQP